MPMNVLRFAMATVLFSAAALSAQSGAPPSSGNPPPSPPPRSRQEPCWLQAGISRSVVEQRQTMEREARSEVEAVCENSSLTPQQKQQQVREIRRQTQEKMEALITPEQQTALHACQQQRGNRAANEGHHPGGAGPCGNYAASQGRQGPTNGNTGGNPQTPQN